MRKVTILALAMFAGSTVMVTATEDYNSSRSNKALAQDTSDSHDTTKPKHIAVGHDDSESDSMVMHEGAAPRDAASGLPTGKRQHKPLQ